MDNLDYIENYFTTTPTPDETRGFENRIQSDPEFAGEVSFYLSVLKISRETAEREKKLRFKEMYDRNTGGAKVRSISPVRKLVYYVSAAAVAAGIIFGIYMVSGPVSPQQLADRYLSENLQNLGVTMSGKTDSMQMGLRLYNDGKPADALVQFEKIIQSDSSNFTAKKYAGLSELRLKEYDKALVWFEQLETYHTLYSNPAQFYSALTLMERNQDGDAARAKILLQQVVQNNLEGKEIAGKWLKKI